MGGAPRVACPDPGGSRHRHTYTDPAASADLVRQLGDGAELRLVEGGRHELLHDHGCDTTLDLVLSWLTDRTEVPS